MTWKVRDIFLKRLLPIYVQLYIDWLVLCDVDTCGPAIVDILELVGPHRIEGLGEQGAADYRGRLRYRVDYGNAQAGFCNVPRPRQVLHLASDEHDPRLRAPGQRLYEVVLPDLVTHLAFIITPDHVA